MHWKCRWFVKPSVYSTQQTNRRGYYRSKIYILYNFYCIDLAFCVNIYIWRILLQRTNYENDWKVVTIFIGGNDLCALDRDEDATPENFIKTLTKALDLLHDTVRNSAYKHKQKTKSTKYPFKNTREFFTLYNEYNFPFFLSASKNFGELGWVDGNRFTSRSCKWSWFDSCMSPCSTFRVQLRHHS